eukprot:2226112-Prymnesium_polylepis.1
MPPIPIVASPRARGGELRGGGNIGGGTDSKKIVTKMRNPLGSSPTIASRRRRCSTRQLHPWLQLHCCIGAHARAAEVSRGS